MSEFQIRRLGQHGDGVADGPVFAPMTLPGELVTGVVQGNTLTDIKIVTPSEQRVAAPCRHFKSCGGCQVQHASDPLVADWKTDVVRNALAAHGLEAELRPILTSPAQSRRRATFAARRTKKGAMAGFYGRGSDVLVEVPDCQLLLPEVLAGLEVAKALAIIGSSRKATLAVQITTTLTGLDVQVAGGKPLDGPLQQHLAQFCENQGLSRLTWEDEVIAMREPPLHGFGRAMVSPPPGAFLQATAHGEAQLLAGVREVVGDADRVADLFAGCGTFALPLAENAEVLAVESEAQMMVALDKGWRMAKGLKSVTHVTRDLYRRPLLPDELAKIDVAVLDPPRSGAEAQVAELARSNVARIAYVSCNPVSFARDAAYLVAEGYELEWVQPVDQFRWSSHIELVASLRKKPQTGVRQKVAWTNRI
ncbi:class I SAM-dependent RNA methyltransferase [Sulfitobacter sp. SK012]|uniref:class I SAM-dependent RNA methyltransferase n=1 Tax=Sulfitobacter sp. SK012 TaxID=1389005 RepID=UPI000E0B8B36|nr:class I SAM-dependent RNA methyltransferase [Sulfitobacter sp. SK012]AXI44645.1 class I SAM-dependent RNA methyltransferase [Sulfitobacter sp. SK012]